MTFQTQKLFLIRNILIKCVFGPVSSSAVCPQQTTCWHSSGCCPDSLPSFQVHAQILTVTCSAPLEPEQGL